MSLTWPDKDPDEVLDYQLDWTARLAGDTISTSSWIVPANITKDSDSNTTTTTTIWLSAGLTADSAGYDIVNRIVTAGGRTMDQTVHINMADK